MEKKTVVAQSPEHKVLLEDGWKPYSAYQGFKRKESCNNLKPTSELLVVMRKN